MLKNLVLVIYVNYGLLAKFQVQFLPSLVEVSHAAWCVQRLWKWMKELIRVKYASRQQCCKTHKRPLRFTFYHSYHIHMEARLFSQPQCNINTFSNLHTIHNLYAPANGKFLLQNLTKHSHPCDVYINIAVVSSRYPTINCVIKDNNNT